MPHNFRKNSRARDLERARPRADEADRIGEVTFRICRLMVARRVLWDEDIGLGIDKLAEAVGASPELVSRALRELDGEGWIVLDESGEVPALTDLGVSSILGRKGSGTGVQNC